MCKFEIQVTADRKDGSEKLGHEVNSQTIVLLSGRDDPLFRLRVVATACPLRRVLVTAPPFPDWAENGTIGNRGAIKPVPDWQRYDRSRHRFHARLSSLDRHPSHFSKIRIAPATLAQSHHREAEGVMTIGGAEIYPVLDTAVIAEIDAAVFRGIQRSTRVVAFCSPLVIA